ncbi:MAG: TIM barrel protein [Armatimonadota bacterium]|jgi:hydroxypyruvate isomerase
MGRIKQSLTWGMVNRTGLEPAESIKKVAEIGFASIEMLPQENWDLVHENGMEIAIVVGHASLRDGLNKRENHDRIEQELLENIELAAANNIPSLICFSGDRHGASDEEGIEVCAEGLSRVAKAAEEKGINLCPELLNSKVNHEGYQCDFTTWGVDLCQRVDSPRVKLLYDIYHMQIMEGDLIRTITENIEYIAHFHTAGNPGRHNIDDEQEIYYPAVMRAIAGTDYDGFVGHELSAKDDPMDAIVEAYKACDV